MLQAVWEQPEEQINSLEARAYVPTLKGRSRSSPKHGQTFLHFKDSQVCLSAFLKHHRPAYTLNFLTQRAAALELAADFQPLLGFVGSHWNPAVKPSRQQWLPKATPRESIDAKSGGSTQ